MVDELDWNTKLFKRRLLDTISTELNHIFEKFGKRKEG